VKLLGLLSLLQPLARTGQSTEQGALTLIRAQQGVNKGWTRSWQDLDKSSTRPRQEIDKNLVRPQQDQQGRDKSLLSIL